MNEQHALQNRAHQRLILNQSTQCNSAQQTSTTCKYMLGACLLGQGGV